LLSETRPFVTFGRKQSIGRTTMVWQTTIRNPGGAIAAIVTQTQIVIPARSAGITKDEG